MKSISKGYHGLLLVIGTSRLFLISDFLFLYELVITPIFTGKRIAYPNKSVLAIAGIILVSSMWSARPIDGVQTAIRVVVLAMILPTYFYGYHYKRVVGVALTALAMLAVFQTSTMLRSVGIHMNASMLGLAAFVFMPIVWLEIGLAVAVIISVSISRSAMVGVFVFALLQRSNHYYFRVALVTGAMFLVYASISTPDRITFGGVVSAIESRGQTLVGYPDEVLETVYKDRICGEFREFELRVFGYGYGGFCDATGQPRPHNIYVLSVYELGILAVPFWGFVIYSGRKLGLLNMLPLILLGLVTDELFGRPEGVYLIAAWIVSIHTIRKTRELEVDNDSQ